jgi:hypothetical protein
MKLRVTIFNSIGLAIAAAAAVVFSMSIINMLDGRGYYAQEHPLQMLLSAGVELVIALCLGLGGMNNLLAGRMKTVPTRAMIAAFFISIILFPLAIWGIYELKLNQDRRLKKKRANEEGRSEDGR